MPVVPGGNVTKFIAVQAAYSPVVSFNPDKKQMFRTDQSNLGLLDGNLTTDGVNVTCPSGMGFIQNGIIAALTAPFVIAIPVGAFPKYVVADLTNENPGTPVTIQIQSVAPPAGQVILATLNPNNATIQVAKKISIKGLSDRIDLPIAVLNNGILLGLFQKINLVGGNISGVIDGGDPTQVNVSASGGGGSSDPRDVIRFAALQSLMG